MTPEAAFKATQAAQILRLRDIHFVEADFVGVTPDQLARDFNHSRDALILALEQRNRALEVARRASANSQSFLFSLGLFALGAALGHLIGLAG